jgi:hypothetical protein
VDRVGRKSETTRVIARLQFEIRAFASTAADEFDKPARAPDAGNGERCRGQRRDTPAGRGGGRLPEIGGFGLPAPSAEGDTDRPGAFGGELEPPRGSHWQTRHFGHDSAEPAMPQALLEAREDGLLVAALEIDDAIRLQPGLR